MGFARDRGFEVLRGAADRQTGRRVTDLLQVFQVAVRMAGFAFCSGSKHRGDVVEALDVSFLSKIQVASIGLRLTRKRFFKVFLGLRALQICHRYLRSLRRRPGAVASFRLSLISLKNSPAVSQCQTLASGTGPGHAGRPVLRFLGFR